MDLEKEMQAVAKAAKDASGRIALISAQKKNDALETMAELLDKNREGIISANHKDIAKAGSLRLTKAMIDRLTLTSSRIDFMIEGLRKVIALPDPIGTILKDYSVPSGLRITKVRVPIGVIFIIYESRPNVTVDSAGLCFKSGNSVILRGGKEAVHSNIFLTEILQSAMERHNLPRDCIQIIKTQSHSAIPVLLKLRKYIDLVIPRGGEKLIETVTNISRIPVIKHYKGICHIYVDKDADLDMASRIVINAKVQRPGVCNALETLLVSKDIADKFIPKISRSLSEDYHVQLRGDTASLKLATGMLPASEKDWSTEYLDLILSVKIVNTIDDAITHINHYGSMHSDSIITNSEEAARQFTKGVDSACVFVNASTRFSDGGEFGMGAEIGISTDKIHARGPMGIEELTSYKYIVRGNGQIRE